MAIVQHWVAGAGAGADTPFAQTVQLHRGTLGLRSLVILDVGWVIAGIPFYCHGDILHDVLTVVLVTS